MNKLLRIFNGFEIPTYVCFDGDRNTDDSDNKKKTLNLLSLVGSSIDEIEEIETKVSDDYAILEHNYEDTLKQEINNYEELCDKAVDELGPTGKPLKHRYIATQLKNKAENEDITYEEVFPNTIIDIIEKIKSTSYTGSILYDV